MGKVDMRGQIRRIAEDRQLTVSPMVGVEEKGE